MGEGPVTAADRKRRPSWKLGSPHDALTQGLVVSGFNDLPVAEALFLVCPDTGSGGGGAWLRVLEGIAPITDADGRDARGAAIAFTFTGLRALGLAEQALASFSAPYREGMYQEDRLRRLGDRVDGTWEATVIDGGPRWGGNTPAEPVEQVAPDAAHRLAAAPPNQAEMQVRTPITVHALLLLYDKDQKAASDRAEAVLAELAGHGVKAVHRLPLDLQLDANGIGREHFGFADGLSQPIPFDDNSSGLSDGRAVLVEGRPAERDYWHGVPLGEILFGHVNGHHEKAPGPVIADDARAKESGLRADDAPEGFLNFGLDGSYLVVRELQQDVAAFWTSMEKGAARILAHDPTAVHASAAWLSERVVGRSIDGHLLCPKDYLAADEDNQPQNRFGFLHTDPHGHGCPPGSHVRRGNPRDGLAKDAASAQTLLDAANNHRILRRGRKYGPKFDSTAERNEERGLLFMCLNTDITRQFEFVQQTWILNCNFATLFDETDPLIGPKGPFTIREKPLRRIVEVDTFVKMAGGEYFFLPSIPALKYLASL